MSNKIVFATGNAGKVKEVQAILADLGMEVVTMKEPGIELDIVEDGTTYEENALIKAREVAKYPAAIVMADDSGIEIEHLDNGPGIFSARFLGEDTSYRIKNNYIIEQLAGVPDEKRTARYVCAIAAVLPEGQELTTRGAFEGRIGYEEAGENGFGYDPIFYVPKFGKTTAQLSPEEKNEISHRAKALVELEKLLLERK